MAAIVLRTARLVLDAPVADDVDAVFEACQDEAIQRWTTVPSPYLRSDAETFVLQVVPRGWESDADEIWAIRTREGGPLLGVISARQALGDVGFWAVPAARGVGYVTEALAAVATHLFARGWSSVEWECLVGNIASARVARKAGFRFEGVAPSRTPERSGCPRPAWHAALSADDDRVQQPGWPGEVD